MMKTDAHSLTDTLDCGLWQLLTDSIATRAARRALPEVDCLLGQFEQLVRYFMFTCTLKKENNKKMFWTSEKVMILRFVYVDQTYVDRTRKTKLGYYIKRKLTPSLLAVMVKLRVPVCSHRKT